MDKLTLNYKTTSVTRRFETVTENAKYVCDLTATDGNLQTVNAIVHGKTSMQVPGPDGNPVMQEVEMELGRMVLSGGTFNLQHGNGFPYSDKLPLYMADFVAIVEAITAPEQPAVEEKKSEEVSE